MDNGSRAFARRLLLCVCALLLVSPGAAWSTRVAWPQSWGCGAPAGRADADPTLVRGTVPSGRGEIAYYRFGQGSPILLVTGFRATLANWNAYFLGSLSRHHEVIVFDNRGIGKSRAADSGYRVEDLADDTAALIDGLDLKGITLLGWSMGGEIVQQVALRHPARIERLVLMATLPPGAGSVPVDQHTLEVLAGSGSGHLRQVMGALFPGDDVDRAMRCFIADMFRPADYTVPTISADVTAAQERLLQEWERDDAAWAQLPKVRLPTLLLTGTADTVAAMPDTTKLYRALPAATRIEVENGGHAMMYQFPADLARQISSFIRARPGR